jgi:hypothetical protein
MKKKIKVITISLLIAIAIIVNTSVFFQHDLDHDILLGNLVYSALANTEEGDIPNSREYCVRCYTEYGQLGVRWTCEVDYNSSCSFVPCLYGYC